MQALVWLPVDNASLDAVQALLRQRDVFTTGYEHVGVDTYDPATYLYAQLLEETSFGFRYDRNVLSRLVEVVQGRPLSEEHRVACGIQVLAQITEAVVEPNTALYELGSGCSHADAEKQLALFRRIDHTHPQHWADLATGRADRLTPEQLADWKGKSIKENDYAKRLNRWRASYAVCLKIASLALSEMGAEPKLLELIRWMEEDLCFLLPGVILANRYLAPNSCRAGLFKQLRSTDRGKALKGIRNQAWDLTLIYAWMEDCRDIATTGKIVILASLDRGLHSIARSVLMATQAVNRHPKLRHFRHRKLSHPRPVVGLCFRSGSALAAPAVPLLAHGFRDWLRWLSSVLDAGGAVPAFSPQASLVGVGGGSPPMPAEEEPPACGRNNPDLRFSLSR